jgi:hypothetical protein
VMAIRNPIEPPMNADKNLPVYSSTASASC